MNSREKVSKAESRAKKRLTEFILALRKIYNYELPSEYGTHNKTIVSPFSSYRRRNKLKMSASFYLLTSPLSNDGHSPKKPLWILFRIIAKRQLNETSKQI